MFLLFLDGRPQIVENSEKEMNITYAEQITMFCTSVGSPLPTITWKKSRRKIGIRIKKQFFLCRVFVIKSVECMLS